MSRGRNCNRRLGIHRGFRWKFGIVSSKNPRICRTQLPNLHSKSGAPQKLKKNEKFSRGLSRGEGVLFGDTHPLDRGGPSRREIRNTARKMKSDASFMADPIRKRLCPILCPPPNLTECYRAFRHRRKALLGKDSVRLGSNS
jgi:hypothetical protein